MLYVFLQISSTIDQRTEHKITIHTLLKSQESRSHLSISQSHDSFEVPGQNTREDIVGGENVGYHRRDNDIENIWLNWKSISS